jgi:ligand-binding SRPBCC domain-containing protein
MRNCYLFILLLSFSVTSCKKAYEPEIILAPNNYLVFDGFINATPNTITEFTLSRTRSITDTVITIPELNAQIIIEGKLGSIYNFTQGPNGKYSTAALTLNTADQYRIKATTADGHQYASAFVTVKQTAPIDSITWQQQQDLKLFVHTHDPTNNSRYYKWDFTETWEYKAPLQTSWGLTNNNTLIALLTPQTQIYTCWTTLSSTNIITGNSIALSADVISYLPVCTIKKDDERVNIRYSMLLNQLAVTEEAYKYWSIIQKNSQQLGTLFDLQPAQLKGNITCTSNPQEPVIGFISAASASQKRIFITNAQLSNWAISYRYNDCGILVIPTDPLNVLSYSYPDPAYVPYYFTGIPAELIISKKECVDCRTRGGVNSKPLFW